MNKSFISLLFFALILFQLNVFSAEEKSQNGIVAVVNGKKIRQEDISHRMKNFTSADPETQNAIKQEIIDQMITDILLEEFIDKQGIVVTTREIERELDQIRINITGNQRDATQSLEQVLMSIGSDVSEFKKSIKHSIALEKYFTNKLDDRALERYFEENKSLFNGESVKVSHILIDTRNMKTGEEFSHALDQIREIKKEIDQGAAFDESAKKYSDCPSALHGGDLGFIQRKGNLAKSFLDVAFSLRPGQISEPVQTEYGYHLIMVTDKKQGLPVQFMDVKEKVHLEVMDEEIIKLLDRLRKEAQIVVKE